MYGHDLERRQQQVAPGMDPVLAGEASGSPIGTAVPLGTALGATLRACWAVPTAVTGNQQSNTDQQMSFLNR